MAGWFGVLILEDSEWNGTDEGNDGWRRLIARCFSFSGFTYSYLLVNSLFVVFRFFFSFCVILGVHKVGWAGSWTGERGHLELAFRSDTVCCMDGWMGSSLLGRKDLNCSCGGTST